MELRPCHRKCVPYIKFVQINSSIYLKIIDIEKIKLAYSKLFS